MADATTPITQILCMILRCYHSHQQHIHGQQTASMQIQQWDNLISIKIGLLEKPHLCFLSNHMHIHVFKQQELIREAQDLLT
jgi:hypothetical protein